MYKQKDEQIKDTRKYLIIADQIKLDILSGKYKTGENIPALRKLAATFNVTTMTVSKATAHLASLGYLDIKQGSGGRVNIPEKISKKFSITLLVNKEKNDLELPINYFYKDIYLSYLLFLNSKKYIANIVSYKKDDKAVSENFMNEIKTSDGVIVLGDLPDCYFRYFDELDIPLVIFDRNVPTGYKSRIGVLNTSMSKLEEAVNYLISLGHKNILFSIDDEIYLNTIFYQRLEIIKKTLGEWTEKIPYKLEVFQFKPNNKESANKLKILIDKGFKASICYNDISALNLYTLADLLNKNIPSDFSIIGIDDIMPSKLALPPLTTIRVDIERLTLKAINIIEQFLTSGSRENITDEIETELIIRKSVYRN
jgi:DNA-binding LacI/PurR family transcriptional regulator